MIIDYDDMISAGIIKEASAFLNDDVNAIHAIYLSTPTGNVGKFRVTNKTDVLNSIDAVEKNASLPDYIKQPAMYYIQKAANVYGIDTLWENIKPQYSNIIELRDADPDQTPAYVLKMAGQKDIPIHNEEDYRRASDMFMTASRNVYTPADRISIAGDLLKVAIDLNIACEPYITAYAHAEYSPHVPLFLDSRIKMAGSEDGAKGYEMLKEAYISLGKEMPPDIFLDTLESIDKLAGIHRDPVQFLEG